MGSNPTAVKIFAYFLDTVNSFQLIYSYQRYGGCSSVVERPLRMRKASGSIPDNSNILLKVAQTALQNYGLVRELNPGPRAPEARIIPLDQRASLFITNLLTHYMSQSLLVTSKV